MVKSDFHVRDTCPLTTAAMQYQRIGVNPLSDLHSSFMLSYLGGRIAIRNGDSERAEGWFFKAMVVAKQCRGSFRTNYLIKVLTNLQVLYTAMDQEGKLAAVVDELEAVKAELPTGVDWPTEEKLSNGGTNYGQLLPVSPPFPCSTVVVYRAT
jgi:hypothetical protein